MKNVRATFATLTTTLLPFTFTSSLAFAQYEHGHHPRRVPPPLEVNIGQDATLVGGQSARIWWRGESSTITCAAPRIVEVRPREFRSQQSVTSVWDSDCRERSDSSAVSNAIMTVTHNAKNECKSNTGQECSIVLEFSFLKTGPTRGSCSILAVARGTGSLPPISNVNHPNSGYVDFEFESASEMNNCGMSGKNYGLDYTIGDAMKDASSNAIANCQANNPGRTCKAGAFTFERPGGTTCRVINTAYFE